MKPCYRIKYYKNGKRLTIRYAHTLYIKHLVSLIKKAGHTVVAVTKTKEI
jgi:hypothetical protein